MAMSREEAEAFVIQMWDLDHTVDGIMIETACRGYIFIRVEIRAIIRQHLDRVTENRNYHGGCYDERL